MAMYPLHRLDQLVSMAIDPLDNITGKQHLQHLFSGLAEAAAEAENIRTYLLNEAFACKEKKELEVYIQTYQAICVSMANKVFYAIILVQRLPYNQLTRDKLKKSYSTIQSRIEELLSFIENHFSQYFDVQQKVPANYARLSREKFIRGLRSIKNKLCSMSKDRELITLALTPPLSALLINQTTITYAQLIYCRQYIKALQKVSESRSTGSVDLLIIDTMISMNVCNISFITYYIKWVKNSVPKPKNKQEKIYRFVSAQNHLKQLAANRSGDASPIVKALHAALNEEIGALQETAEIVQRPGSKPEPLRHFLRTHLSVAQLALLLRLLVDTNIIKCHNQSLFLKVIATAFRTSRVDIISPESLRTKYYTSEPAAKSAIRSHLLTMINHLHKYY
jgi:hypothetical protein